jgi:hypothetical protein
MKIRLTKETNHLKETVWYNIERWNRSYWENIYSHTDEDKAMQKFEQLKIIGNESTKQVIQEFEKKVDF